MIIDSVLVDEIPNNCFVCKFSDRNIWGNKWICILTEEFISDAVDMGVKDHNCPISVYKKSIYYHDAVSAGKVSVDVKTSTDNNKRSKWKAYVPGWGAPTANKRYLVKLINDWITIATYYLRVGGGYWKDDRGQELADGVVSLWKGLDE